MKFEDVQMVFIVGRNNKDKFSEWLVELGLHWFAKDWDKLKQEFEEKNILLIEDDNPKIKTLINKLNNNTNRIIWFIGCNHIISLCDPFSNYFYNTRSEWELFKKQQKEIYERFTNNN